MKDPFHAISLLEEGRVLTPSELFLIAHLAYSTGRTLSAMAEAKRIPWPKRAVPPSLAPVEKRLLPGSSGQPVFYVVDSYSSDLAKVRAERKNREKALRAEMAKEADAVESLIGRKVGLREEIAIRKSNPDMVDKARLMPELGETRETLTHVHFRLKAARGAVRLEREINRLRQREAALEGDILAALSRELAPKASQLQDAAWALGELDFLICKADLALRWNASVPEVYPEHTRTLRVEEGFHPSVQEEVESRGGRFQPLTLDLDEPVTVITGPNMGGKTVSLRTAGLCVALAQYGFLVPAKGMSFSLYDFVYFQPQTPGKPGLSSFAEEVLSLKDPLSRQGERGLVLLDEVGRGTNPSQGLALYAAALQYMREQSPRSTVIATTHYHGLAALVGAPHWQVAGLRPESFDSGSGPSDINWLYKHMDYRLQKVGPDAPTPQDALLVARILGLHESIIARAMCLIGRGKVTMDETPF
ncbi:MAG: MutS-related protein [Bacillota bacterium]